MSSIVSSFFSSRTVTDVPRSRHSSAPPASTFSRLMDSLLAIGVGLSLRVLISVVSQGSASAFKLTGTLVGLWEGVVLMHFLQKMPSSFDPYVAYGVRLFIDFLFTESLPRLALVLIWTGLGMVLADISPAIWDDAGLKHVWNRFRRDITLISQSFVLPTFPFWRRNTPSRVRFHHEPSPSRASATSFVSSFRSRPSTLSTSTTVSASTASAPSTISTATITPVSPRKPKSKSSRPVPGAFPGYASETETERGSIILFTPPPTTIPTSSVIPPSEASNTHRPLSVIPEGSGYASSSASSVSEDVDGKNVSSSSSSSSSTADEEQSPTNLPEIPEVDEEEELVMPSKDKGKAREIPEDYDHEGGSLTPKQRSIAMPPTPADSWDLEREENAKEITPPLAEVPSIPDNIGDTVDDGWENVERPKESEQEPGEIADDIWFDQAKNTSTVPPLPPPKDNVDDTTPRDSKGLPPPYQDIYDGGYGFSDNAGTNKDDDTKTINASNIHDQETRDSLAPSSPKPSSHKSIPDSDASSVLTQTASSRLADALILRKQAYALDKELNKIETERQEAVAAGNNPLALAKKVEKEDKEKEAKKLHERAERRFFKANNPSKESKPITELKVQGLEGDEAVRRTEEALESLLRSSSSYQDASLSLKVTFGKGPKGLVAKQRVRDAMLSHKMIVKDNSRDLIIHLPSFDID